MFKENGYSTTRVQVDHSLNPHASSLVLVMSLGPVTNWWQALIYNADHRFQNRIRTFWKLLKINSKYHRP